ncbi:ABC transporter substrate-binding protein [Compostimonas suwonensis]|uniref:Thiamine pyrimidine synthase n=1 Tax=Compostimonas suwonensis TaxID=1048394 RepID=A0A2M9C4A7_9MICO|nr:ABC transporter substrate-binding protein [Compostimonas suwonensis]PJJ65358.1 NitT/TauT family transport system substrate-binding protein [Compostimonas suwonensis]
MNRSSSTRPPRGRRVITRMIGLGAVALLGVALTACSSDASPAASGSAEATGPATPVTLQLDWIPFGRHAPFYVAKALGYYEDAGVDVTLVQGSGVAAGYQALAADQADMVFNDLSDIVSASQEQGDDLIATAVFYSVAPHSVFFLKSSGITSPKDLEGKTIAYSAGQSPYQLFPLFAEANGIDASTINWQQVAPQSLNQTFLSGQADAMVTYVLTDPVLQGAAPQGEEVEHFTFGEMGVDLLNNGLITKKSYLDENPDVVKAVTQATVKGYEYAFEHPEEAVDLMMKEVPTLNRDDAIKEIALIKGIVQLPGSTEPIGYIDPTEMADTVATMSTFDGISPAPDPTKYYTNEFVQ